MLFLCRAKRILGDAVAMISPLRDGHWGSDMGDQRGIYKAQGTLRSASYFSSVAVLPQPISDTGIYPA
jgi:hypothetical protein